MAVAAAPKLFPEPLERNKSVFFLTLDSSVANKMIKATMATFKAPPMLKDVAHKPAIPENGMIFIISCSDNRIEP